MGDPGSVRGDYNPSDDPSRTPLQERTESRRPTQDNHARPKDPKQEPVDHAGRKAQEPRRSENDGHNQRGTEPNGNIYGLGRRLESGRRPIDNKAGIPLIHPAPSERPRKPIPPRLQVQS